MFMESVFLSEASPALILGGVTNTLRLEATDSTALAAPELGARGHRRGQDRRQGPRVQGHSIRAAAGRAAALESAKVPILGTSPDAIDLAEDRDRFKALIDQLGSRGQPEGVAIGHGE